MSDSLASLGKLLGSETRSAMLDLLMDGADHSAAELAHHSGVAPSTASWHLSTLVDGGLLEVREHGRQRRFRLTLPAARAIEALGELARPAPPSSLRSVTARGQLEKARTCYDHLAGRLGVAITDALLERDALRAEDGVLGIGPNGSAFFFVLGIDLEALRRRRRPIALSCIDWTEARPHLAGSLGSALRHVMTEGGWIRKRRGTRAVQITEPGRVWLRETLDIDAERLAVSRGIEPSRGHDYRLGNRRSGTWRREDRPAPNSESY